MQYNKIMEENESVSGEMNKAEDDVSAGEELARDLTRRKFYDTPIGPVCMSEAEREAYLEKLEDN